MADKEKDGGKADKAERAAKVDKSPEAQARAEKAAAAKAKAAAKKEAEAGEKKPREPEEKVTPRLRTHFDEVIRKAMIEQFGYKNPMQVPKVEKVVVNMGLGEAITNNKLIEQAEEQMMAITGQKGVVTRSRKSIANFKLRENQPIGVMATLRKDRMYEFLDRLLSTALPRVRDFKGVSAKSFDGRGNYTLGIKEQIIFPEINYDRIEKIKGMNVTIVTTARSDEEGRALLRYFGMPFRTA